MNTNDRTRSGAGHTFILILIFILMSAGIITAGYIYSRNYEQDFRVKAESQLSGIAELKVSELTLWRKERLGDGAVLFKNRGFSDRVRSFLEKPGDVNARLQLQGWLEKYHTAYQYAQVSLFDTRGIQRMLVPPTSEPVDSFTAQNTGAILRGGQVILQDFHRESPDRPIHLAILVPILDESDDSRPLGVFVMDIDPATYLYPYIGRWPIPSQTAETLLVRRDGDDVLFLNEVKFHKNSPLNLRIPLTKTDVPTVKAALGERGIVQGVGYDGEPVTAAVLAVPDSPWYLAAKINIAEEYAPVKKRLWETLAFVGVLLLGSAVAVGFVWRERSARFYREQYEAADTLKRTEEKFRAYIENISDSIWVFDSSLKVTYVSPSVTGIIGYTPGELIDMPSQDCIHPDDLPMVIEAQTRVLEHPGQPVTAQYRVIHKNGEYVHVESTGVSMLDNPAVQGVIIAMRDITERRAVEEITPDIFYSIDLQGNLQRWNHSLETLCGLSVEQMKGRPCLDFVCEEDRPIVAEDIQKVLTNGSATNTYRFIRGDGALIPFHCNGTLILNSRGEPSGFAGFGRDISELQEKERLLRAAKDMAEGATKLKDKFVELVAHDLRSPFTSIIGLLKLLVERIPHIEDAENQNILDRIFKSGDRMIATIDDLLKVSRLQTGQIAPHPRFFKGHMAAAVTIQSLSHNAAQKGVEIINEVPADMRLYADPSLFDEVLLNFLSNAVKFCSRGDKITFFVPPGLKSAIAVRDTGKGVSEKIIPNIFKHEVKTTTPGTAGELGTGLGLPFSNDIMQAHGGELTVESAPGKGSVFCAILPYVKPVALIVDDDELALAVLGEHLKKIGVDVITAVDGEKALEALKDGHPHIVIADINMPEMDGFELLNRLKQEKATSGIPVIVMTASDKEAREKALMSGADDFVGKPFDVADFIPRVRRFVG
jgi:PAS domain S-box-containing protein